MGHGADVRFLTNALDCAGYLPRTTKLLYGRA